MSPDPMTIAELRAFLAVFTAADADTRRVLLRDSHGEWWTPRLEIDPEGDLVITAGRLAWLDDPDTGGAQ